MYAIIQWSDKGSGLLNLANVTGLKRGNVAEYKDGDYIYAMHGKHKYRARISEKNGKNHAFYFTYFHACNIC